MMDSVYFGGRLITMDEDCREATAMAVKDGVIQAVGGDEEILALAGPSTQRFDLRGACVTPGLADSHMHLLSLGDSYHCADLSPARSIAQMQDILLAFMQEHPTGPVEGRGWNQDLFAEKRLPTRDDLDQLSLDRPIVLSRVCGHMVVCNSYALQKYRIDAETSVPGGTIERDENGRLNGLLTENAVSLVYESAGPRSVQAVKERLSAALRHCASQGLTAVSSEDFCSLTGASYETILQAYAELEAEDALPLRLYLQAQLPDLQALQDFFDRGYGPGYGGKLYKIASLKLLADGSLGARTAYLRRPYADDPATCGVAVYRQEELDALVRLSHAHGLPVSIHAIGDAAMDMVLEAIEKAQAAMPGRGLRHGVIHCQITDEGLLDRFQRLGTQALVQPVFLEYDAHIADSRVGSELASSSYNWDGFLRRRVPVSGGTDCPVEPVSPLLNLYCAITRKDFSGQPQGGFYPSHCLTPRQALALLTTGAAYAVGEEALRGKLKPGYLADFTGLSVDPLRCAPEELLSAKALFTVVGGRPRFLSDPRALLCQSPIPAFGSTQGCRSADTQDSGEDMLDITDLDPRIVFDRSYVKMGVPGAMDRCLMRRGVFEKLQAALDLLGEGYGFLVFDALRPLPVQQALFDKQLACVRSDHPELTLDQAREETREFVALPIRDEKRPSTHMTGGAVDLTLCYEGRPLDMGTVFDDFRENAHSDFYERGGLTEAERDVRDNRRLLYNLLRCVGFTNYESEWWHFDYGDLSWGGATGRVPFYGHYDI